jgi:predicted lipoprotein with Yx(FWY)xxD motif
MRLKSPVAGRTPGAIALVGVALFVAACGSSNSSNSNNEKSASSGSATQSSSSSSSGTAKALKLMTASGSAGTYLTDGSGRALYLWVADGKGSSSCMGACAQAWPPLLDRSKPSVTGNAKASDLSLAKRPGGQEQVTYKGHPLYYYIGDTSAGKTTGQGSDGFGAKWWLVAPTGAAITKLSGGSSSSSSY